MISKLRKFFEFDVQPLPYKQFPIVVLEYDQENKPTETSKIINEYLALGMKMANCSEVIEAMIECVDCLQYRNEYSESKIEEALATLREKLGE
jgi:hypothetical protein